MKKEPINVKEALLSIPSFKIYCDKYGFDPEGYASSAANAITIPEGCNPNLKELTSKILIALQNGLYIDGRQFAYIIVTRGGVRMDISYKGYCAILSRDPSVASAGRKLVHKQDKFSVTFENGEYKIQHSISPDVNRYGKREDIENNIQCAYGFITRKCKNERGFFVSDFEIMTVADIKFMASMSKTSRPDSPWSMHYNDMASKTVFKKLLKRQPGLDVVEDEEEEDRQVSSNGLKGSVAIPEGF